MSTNKKYWLQCNADLCKHVFDVNISNITFNERGCPYCSHKRLCHDELCEPCKRRSFASHPRSKNWDQEKNDDITPRNVFKTSHDSYWFKCDNEHSFSDTLGHITDKKEPRWCGICLKNDEIKMRSDKYLTESKEIAKERNGELLSTEYIDMNKSLDWKCTTCNHQWSASLSSIKQGSWCPKCANCIPYTLDDCNASAKLKEGKCLSNQYINNSTTMQWQCKDGYIWSTSYANIVSGTWCPHCVNRAPKTLEDAKKLAEENDGECISTEYINAKTHLMWKCKNGHIWPATYDSIRTKKCWCPECDQSKGEVETRELFEKITGKPFNKKRSIFSNKKMELDGYNDELKIGFEQQGLQHYEYVPFFHRNDITNFEKQIERDQQKRDECKTLGIHLIEIPYTLKGKEKEDFICMKLSEVVFGIKD